jgi:hypothetical protein
MTATVEFDGADTDGERVVRFEVNGTTVILGTRIQANQAASNFPTILTSTVTAVLAVSDFITCQARQNSGATLDVTLREFAAIRITR